MAQENYSEKICISRLQRILTEKQKEVSKWNKNTNEKSQIIGEQFIYRLFFFCF